MMLASVLRDLFRSRTAKPPPDTVRRRVLNVGGGDKVIRIPGHYDGWEHLLLDIDGRERPDIVCDARNLVSLTAGQFDAVYCAHNLEHYYRHDSVIVLRGFLHVLKADGFAEIRVPDIQTVIQRVEQPGMDIGDVLYESAAGPITVHDVVYGFGKEIEQSGQDFYAHKTGYTPKSLQRALEHAGFMSTCLFVMPEAFEVRAFAFKSEPTAAQRGLLDAVRVHG